MNKRRLRKAFKRLAKLPVGMYFFLYAINKFRHFYYKVVRSTKVAYPSTIMLELTNHCNLACTTCPREYDYGKLMDKGVMDVDAAKNVIDKLWPYLDSVGLTGMGETFMAKDIEKIVDYIKSKNRGIIISISTNAMLPNFIELAKRVVGKIDTIQISIDGVGEVYEKIRKKASYETLYNNLVELSKITKGTDTDLMLNMVVTKENYFHMHKIFSLAAEIGIKYVDFTLFNLASVTNVEKSYYDFYKSDEFLNELKTLEEVAEKTNSVTVSNNNFETDNGFRKCPFPWTHFYICWNGFVAPCCAKPFPKELNFGNVFTEDVMDVLNSSSYRNFRKMWYKNTAPEFCNKCHFIDIEPIKK
ncbi:MAG: SPASM domain-containing protein [Bacteroidetes bacterium]|nr:SPASM domain-containing protein [Bacteroidota bacterium]